MHLEVLLIYQIHHHLHHHVLIFRTGLSNHQCKCYQGVFGSVLSAVLAVQNAFFSINVQIIHVIRLLNLCKFCTSDIPVKFSFLEAVVDMSCYYGLVSTKEFRHLACAQHIVSFSIFT